MNSSTSSIKLILLAALAIAMAACAADSGGSGGSDGNGIDVPEDGTVVGECGDLDEGFGECAMGRLLNVCESGDLVEYECPVGSVCDVDAQGVGCFCDNARDGLCPDALCTEDPDCGEEEPDPVDLTPRGFVTVGAGILGQLVVFEDFLVYENTNQVVITAEVGPDCPLPEDCRMLYVQFPVGAAPGDWSCTDPDVGVQLTSDGNRYFSSGSSAVFCNFRLDVNDGSNVVVSDLTAHLEMDPDSPLVWDIDLSNGEIAAPRL